MAAVPPPQPPKPNPPTIAARAAAGKGKDIKKRKNLTYAEKWEIIKKIDDGTPKRRVAALYGINESTVRGIYQKKDHIKSHIDVAPTTAALNVKRSANRVLVKTEQLLQRYVEKMARRNLAVDTKEVMDVAKDIYQGVARKWSIEQPPLFLASKGWFERFSSRHKLKSSKISGEAASGDQAGARQYPDKLRDIINEGQYTFDQIFNMDETNFFWKTMPRRTFITTKSAKLRGRKAIKERFTLLLATNASGSCRMKPTIVHRAKRPRAYKGKDMDHLNVHWLSSKKGYVSAKLSLDWLKRCLIPEVKRFCERNNVRFNILLLLDNAPGHSPVMSDIDPNVRVEFLPPNTTSLIQPLDQEVISVVKASYSRRQFRLMRQATEDTALIQRLINEEELEEQEEIAGDNESEERVVRYWKCFNIKQAVDLAVSCWNDVTQATIHHAWRNVLEGLPDNRQVTVPGVPQTVEAEIEGAVEEARLIPGVGFADITRDEIQEMLHPPAVSAMEILEEDNVNDGDIGIEEEHDAPVENTGLSMADIKQLIEMGINMRHILEQDTTINNAMHCANISQAIAIYEEKYRAHVNNLRQRKMTDFLARRQQEADPQPDPQQPGPSGVNTRPGPLDDDDDDDDDDVGMDFEGFLDDMVGRRGGPK